MTPAILSAVRWAVAAGVVAVVVAVTRRGDQPLVIDAYVLFVGALVLRVLVRATRLAAPAEEASPFEAALRPATTPPARAASLEALERTVLLATETAIDCHVRLRPVLQEIAEHRLAAKLGIDLSSPRAADALGAAWPLVRPDVRAPAERFEKGIPLGELGAAVAALEKI